MYAKIVMGSKHPRRFLFNFENNTTALRHSCLGDFVFADMPFRSPRVSYSFIIQDSINISKCFNSIQSHCDDKIIALE